jgi:hypothetical protein
MRLSSRESKIAYNTYRVKPAVVSGPSIEIEIEIEIVYNMYRMRRFTPNTIRAGCCLSALQTMPYKKLTSQG